MPVRFPEDQYLETLASLMDECSDDLSKAGNGCDMCSAADDCRRFWESIQPGRGNQLSIRELRFLTREFQQIRAARQVLMLLTV